MVRFLLVCEGSSDGALVHHIRALLIQHGATEADGISSHFGISLTKKVEQGLDLSAEPDLLFVHRDADHYRNTHAAGATKRYEEITIAVQSLNHDGPYVRIVPVPMTEAWLLVNECAIRQVSGNPDGRGDLGLPDVQTVERIEDPKQLLRNVLLRAGSPKGIRREKNFKNNFGEHRRQLIENLPVGGQLEHLDSWVRFRDDTIAALQALGSQKHRYQAAGSSKLATGGTTTRGTIHWIQ